MSRDVSDSKLRTVHLPLEKLENCAICGKTTTLRLCSACGEQQYCSPACQKEDWPKHKGSCGKTDRIDLASFYPFLACLVDACHIHPEKPQHPAVRHTILNSPTNPGSKPTIFLDNFAAKLVILGEPIDFPETESESVKWWPTAASPAVRSKLFSRIWREGYLLPILTSVCIGLLAEIYTTTAVSASDSPDEILKRRIRLQYRGSPITDFGISKGIVLARDVHKLAYLHLMDATFQKGQDPDDHYWFYFTTIRGEEFILDCGLYTFENCTVVPSELYCRKVISCIGGHAPATFHDRSLERYHPAYQQEKSRFSFLRNETLHDAVAHSGTLGFRPVDLKAICKFMEDIAERKCSAIEKKLAIKWSIINCRAIGITLREQAWVNWPSEPTVKFQTDPEIDKKMNDVAWSKYSKKWHRKYKRGEISYESVITALLAWDECHPLRSD